MILPVNLDIDHLHEATEHLHSGQYRYSDTGKTTAYIYQMLGEVELGHWENTYLYIGHNERVTQQVALEFGQLVREVVGDTDGSHFNRRSVDLKHGPRFTFSTMRFHHSIMCGANFVKIYMDLDDREISRLKSTGLYGKFMEDALPMLCYTGGDIL